MYSRCLVIISALQLWQSEGAEVRDFAAPKGLHKWGAQLTTQIAHLKLFKKLFNTHIIQQLLQL